MSADGDSNAGGDLVPLDHTALASVAPSYERMRLAIAECSRVDEIANLADRAVAAQAYFRQSQDLSNELEASRIRLRAERRLGEILKAMAANGQRASKQETLKHSSMSRGATSMPTLADLGIPRDRASRAMQLAEVPEPEFEAALAEPRPAQPRRMLEERKPVASSSASPAPAVNVPDETRLASLWVLKVLAIRDGIERGELPQPARCRAKFAPADLEKLRGALPGVIRYLEQVRIAICPRCDGEGCAHCSPSLRGRP